MPDSFLKRMLRHIVFGLEDGSVSTLGAVTGIAIGTQNAAVVLLSGLVIIAVEALSMGAGTYLSSKATRKAYENTIVKLHKALHSKPSIERSHLVKYYQHCGLTRDHAEKVVSNIASDHKALLMDLEAHEIKVTPDSFENAAESGLVMWVAYVMGGVVPLVFYWVLGLPQAIYWSVAGTLVFLFLVGFTKARVTGEKPLSSALEMLAVSASAALIGFVVGRLASLGLGI